MSLSVLAGTANAPLAEAVIRELGVPTGGVRVARFPDGELEIELATEVRGRDVYVIQPTCAPVGENLLELLLIADAAWRNGASALTAVIPYFGYARQDRRTRAPSPLGARVLAEALGRGHFGRVVAVDLHTPAIEGCFQSPIDHLSAVPLLIDRLRPSFGPDSVIVSPDLGAMKRAERFSRDAQLPVAVALKTRVSGSEVTVRGVVGEVAGRRAVIVDDLISTAGTVESAVHALLEAGAVEDVTVVASHALLVGPALQRLSALPVKRLVTTDSVAPPDGFAAPFPIERVSLAPLLAGAIRRLHQAFHNGAPAA